MLLAAKFHLDRCNMSPMRSEKQKNRSLGKNNTGRAAHSALRSSAGNYLAVPLLYHSMGQIIKSVFVCLCSVYV